MGSRTQGKSILSERDGQRVVTEGEASTDSPIEAIRCGQTKSGE